MIHTIDAQAPPPLKTSELNIANPAAVMMALGRALTTTEELLTVEEPETRALLNRVLLNQALLLAALSSLIGGMSGAFRQQVIPAPPHLRGI